MRRNSGFTKRYPGHYRHDLVLWQMSRTGLTPKAIAQRSKQASSKVSTDTVTRAIDGDCRTITKLWAIAEILNLDFSHLFNFDLQESEFHCAVLAGEPSSGR